jgi:hypothetical protein
MVWILSLVIQAAGVDLLVERLYSEDIEIREAATCELVALGAEAVEPMKRLAESAPDPEVRGRAGAVLKALRWTGLRLDVTIPADGRGRVCAKVVNGGPIAVEIVMQYIDPRMHAIVWRRKVERLEPGQALDVSEQVSVAATDDKGKPALWPLRRTGRYKVTATFEAMPVTLHGAKKLVEKSDFLVPASADAWSGTLSKTMDVEIK